jgi:hypothetical protein
VGDDDEVEQATASTGRAVERSAADTPATVSLDPEAQADWDEHLREQHDRAQPDPWDVPSSPSDPPAELDPDKLRQLGEDIIDGIRDSIETVPGAQEIIDVIRPRPLVSEAETGAGVDDDVLGVASMHAATPSHALDAPTEDFDVDVASLAMVDEDDSVSSWAPEEPAMEEPSPDLAWGSTAEVEASDSVVGDDWDDDVDGLA